MGIVLVVNASVFSELLLKLLLWIVKVPGSLQILEMGFGVSSMTTRKARLAILS
jgi:hypothetical protein